MNAKPARRGISAAPPAVPNAAAEAFVKGAAVHVATPVPVVVEPPAPAPPTGAKLGRPRKYDTPPKALTVRVPFETFEDLRYLEYFLRKGSIQEIAAELLEQAAKDARSKVRAGEE